MPLFSIPKPFIPGFEAISKLTMDEVLLISNALAKIPQDTPIRNVRTILTTSVYVENMDTIARTVVSLAGLLASQESTPKDKLASDLATSFAELKTGEISDEKRKELEVKLSTLFQASNGIKTAFKAVGLLSENDKVFQQSRIVTDVRIVFNDKIDDQNRKSVIIHTLKIDFIKNQNNKQFFVCLDTEDLNQLKSQIDRALEKEKSIKNDYALNVIQQP